MFQDIDKEQTKSKHSSGEEELREVEEQLEQERIKEIENEFTEQSQNGFGETEEDQPTFTNEVVIIRPQIFYENEEAHQDNKFMKFSGKDRQDTNAEVSPNCHNSPFRPKKSSTISRKPWSQQE